MDTPFFGACVGRFNPPHRGHERLIRAMLDEYGTERSLILVGSCNADISERNPFTFKERTLLIRMLFPENDLRVIGIPDVGNWDKWLRVLDEHLEHLGMNPHRTEFFTGSEKDIPFFTQNGRVCRILDRNVKPLSATEVRERLVKSEPIEEMVNPKIADRVKKLFAEKRELLGIAT